MAETRSAAAPPALTDGELERYEALLNGIGSPTPWHADLTEPHDMVVWAADAGERESGGLVMNIGEPIARVGDVCGSEGDARFIAEAPAIVRALIDAYRASRDEVAEYEWRLRAAEAERDATERLYDAASADAARWRYIRGWLGVDGDQTDEPPYGKLVEWITVDDDKCLDAAQEGIGHSVESIIDAAMACEAQTQGDAPQSAEGGEAADAERAAGTRGRDG